MYLFDKDFKEIFFSQIISVIGGLIAGTVLAIYSNKLLIIPGILLLIPSFLEMRGSISGTLFSRISSGLFLGVIKTNRYNTKIVKGNAVSSFVLSIIVSIILGFIVFLFNYYILGVFYIWVVFLPILAAIISSIIDIPIVFISTFYLFKKGHDPNNIMGPFITSTGDVISVIGFLVGVLII